MNSANAYSLIMKSRMGFIATVLTLALLHIASPLIAAPSLIPAGPDLSPDYFCTWNIEGKLISKIGLSASTKNHLSEPGLILLIKDQSMRQN